MRKAISIIAALLIVVAMAACTTDPAPSPSGVDPEHCTDCQDMETNDDQWD